MPEYDCIKWWTGCTLPKICYCDTDSVIFLYDEENPEHKNHYLHAAPAGLDFGSGLGQWEDEFDGKDYIEELVVGGAKSYSYKTAYGCIKKGKVMVKQKGITLDRANDQVVNFETMKDMVLNNQVLKSMERHQFKWDNQTKDIVTKHIARSITRTVKDQRTMDGFDTLPFGYVV